MIRAFLNNRDYLIPALAVSMAGHVAAFALWGSGFSSPNEYRVEIGPNTIEVVSLSVATEREPQQGESHEVLKSKDSDSVSKSLDNRRSVPGVSAGTIQRQGALPRAQPMAMDENPAPNYPRTARQNGWQGEVELTVLVSRDGFPQEVSVTRSSGYDVLDYAARETVEQWRFTAARQDGRVLSARVKVPVRFELSR